MLESVLQVLHNGLTLLFGVLISASFSGVKIRERLWSLTIFYAITSILNLFVLMAFGDTVSSKVYPLVIHLPLVIFMYFYYHVKIMSGFFSVMTAYMCCQISKWLGLFALALTDRMDVYYGVRIVVTSITFVVLVLFVSEPLHSMMRIKDRSLLIFALLPFTYYVFDYLTGVYTDMLYSGSQVATEFLGFVLCIAYLLFITLFFKQYVQSREAEQRAQLMELQQFQSKKEIEFIARSAHAVSMVRHDMRHFLANISDLIEAGEIDRAKSYIEGIIKTTEKTAKKSYCTNTIVNMILSSYEERMADMGVQFTCKLQIPEKLEISDVDLTCILSNALENAIHAMETLNREKRIIQLDMRMNDKTLLFSLKNPVEKHVEMVDGIPQSDRFGHGLGTQSIYYVTEKLGGHCQFTETDGWFILRIVI